MGMESTGNQRNSLSCWKAAAFSGGTSRMNREIHVRICERLGVQFPGPNGGLAGKLFGISGDLIYMDKPQEANSELQKIIDQARSDGETRLGLFGMAVVAADGGKFDRAAQEIDKEYAIAEKKNDVGSMAADLQAKGNILLEARKYAD